jgi:Protein of unknown function (DUF1559)
MDTLAETQPDQKRASPLGPILALATWVLAGIAAVFTEEPYFLAALGTCALTALIGFLRRKAAGRFGWSPAVALAALIAGSLMFPAIDNLREGARSANCRLVQIALAFHNYNDAHGGFLPGQAIRSSAGRPLLSWRVAILPYLEQQELYKRFHLDEPWDSPHNLALLTDIPLIYRPHPNVVADPNTTLFQVFVGPGTPFGTDAPGIPRTFVDGTSNTILVAEASVGVPWTKPADLVYDPHGPLPRLGKVLREDRLLFRVKQPTTFRVALADGSGHSVSKSVSESTLRAAITCAGGEQLGPDW